MIRIERLAAPHELTPAVVLELTSLYAGDRNLRVWAQPYIQRALLEMSKQKCCYCETKLGEEAKYLEVEHFKCKDLYPEDVVNWDNLLPACKRCNMEKSSHDVELSPIVDPSRHHPQNHFRLFNYRLLGADPLGENSVEVLNLNDTKRMTLKRFEIGERTYRVVDDLYERSLDERRTSSVVLKNRIVRGLRSVMAEGGRDAEYAATVATVLLSYPKFFDVVDCVKSLGAWSDEFSEAETELRANAFFVDIRQEQQG